MGEHSYEPRYTEPKQRNERYPTYYNTDQGTDNAGIVSTADSIDIGDVGHIDTPGYSDVDSFQMPPQTLSAARLVQSMRESSPLKKREQTQLAPPMTRYIPPPMPQKSDAQRELNEAAARLAELQDELELVRVTSDKKEQQLHRREKELEALRKVLKEEVSSHDTEVDKLKSITSEKVKQLQMDIEELQDNLADREAEIEVHMKQHERDLSKENRKEIHVENIKLTKELSQLRHELDEANSSSQLSVEKLDKIETDRIKLERRLNEVLKRASGESYDEMNVAIFTELELARKDKFAAEVKLNRLETSTHQQGTEVLRMKKERERLLKRLHDAERESGTATRSTAKLEKDSTVAVEAAEKAELRRAETESVLVELKRKLVMMQEDNRRLESQIDQQKVMQIESDREKLQIEAKLREAEFKQEAIQVNKFF